MKSILRTTLFCCVLVGTLSVSTAPAQAVDNPCEGLALEASNAQKDQLELSKTAAEFKKFRELESRVFSRVAELSAKHQQMFSRLVRGTQEVPGYPPGAVYEHLIRCLARSDNTEKIMLGPTKDSIGQTLNALDSFRFPDSDPPLYTTGILSKPIGGDKSLVHESATGTYPVSYLWEAVSTYRMKKYGVCIPKVGKVHIDHVENFGEKYITPEWSLQYMKKPSGTKEADAVIFATFDGKQKRIAVDQKFTNKGKPGKDEPLPNGYEALSTKVVYDMYFFLLGHKHGPSGPIALPFDEMWYVVNGTFDTQKYNKFLQDVHNANKELKKAFDPDPAPIIRVIGENDIPSPAAKKPFGYVESEWQEKAAM